MTSPVYNLHNHTPFSDGAHTIDELCEAHLAYEELDVKGIGICDHLFRTPSSRDVKSERDFERLFANEVRNYVAEVHEARQRWGGKLQIFCGAEINWPLNKEMLDSIRNLLEGIDYVLFEFIDWAGLTQLANQAKRWPCPVGLAHTHVTTQFPNTSLDQVVRTLANARIFYEVNVKHIPFSDSDPWYNLLPNHRVALSIGTDTHDDLGALRHLKTIYDYLTRLDLEKKLLAPSIREEKTLAASSNPST